MMAALSERLPQEREMCRLLQTHRLLKAMLHSRMERLMQQYHPINSAFAQVKQHTSVRTVDEFVVKFLKKDELYGELLQKIATAEPQI